MAQITTAGGLTLAYETFGSPSDPPLLMVMGFGAQLIAVAARLLPDALPTARGL